MHKVLWTPSKAYRDSSYMQDFMNYVNRSFGTSFTEYSELQKWSVDNVADFWGALWQYYDVICSKPYEKVVDDETKMPGTRWYVGAKMNYAENLLRFADREGTALVFLGEDFLRKEYSWKQLKEEVQGLATAFRKAGIGIGDGVAGYLPNLPETIIAMLAAASVGAVWCSCATDIGANAAVDRIGQISPKILVTTDGYRYKGKTFSTLENVKAIAEKIPSLEKVVITHFAGDGSCGEVKNAVLWEDFLEKAPADFAYEQLDASHPLVVMFSSGTTGKPKCMVQSHAGILMNQLKELQLHCNLGPDDNMLYITTCSWMMWNWQAAGLGVGCRLVLFDGNPSYPDDAYIWKVLEQEKVTAFGLSASYIHSLIAHGFVPKDHADLSAIKTIMQTGSGLTDAGWEFMYTQIKEDYQFNSIAGGTDINGCFGIGNPLIPVYKDMLSGIGLGEKVRCYDENGKEIWDQEGELVCEKPIPSMPLYFWNDPDGSRYFHAYFDVYPGVWRHGDYVVLEKATGGISYHGRSDSVLKPSGVRIGTAEIYNNVSVIEAIEDSLAIGQDYHGDQRILLFVKCKPGYHLDEALKKEIKTTLRTKASPRHVPALIFEVPAIPATLNGKKVESSVTNIVNGRAVNNRDALSNPESLDFFEALLPELQK